MILQKLVILPMHQTVGKYLIITGVILLLAGAVIYFSQGRLKWLGNLPGDIRIVKDNYRIYIPLTTIILLSILLTLVFNIIKKLF